MKYRNIIKKLVNESGTTNPEKLCKYLGIKIYYTKMNFMGFIVKINKRCCNITWTRTLFFASYWRIFIIEGQISLY